MKVKTRADLIENSNHSVALYRCLRAWRMGECTFEQALLMYSTHAMDRIKELESRLIEKEINTPYGVILQPNNSTVQEVQKSCEAQK